MFSGGKVNKKSVLRFYAFVFSKENVRQPAAEIPSAGAGLRLAPAG
jgi:hypothetical protein